MINEYLPIIKEWLTNRLKERTTYDGVILVGAGVAYLLLKPIAVLVAYAAIGYGLWTLYKSETK